MKTPVVMVSEGKLQGCVNTLLDGSEYYSFKGIPYALPPVGKLRFKAPLPPLPWEGILDATTHGQKCPQRTLFGKETKEGSENCLFLNIYSRSLKPDSKIPVMVHFHGEAFVSGSGDEDRHGPEFLLQHDVVLVTMNFRLEVFGFLCLDIPEVPGNAGLKDQVAALRWIKNNIIQFGGDPENVTIFGVSSGGVAVTCHMISPMSKGLFHKAIAQSGTFLSHWSLQLSGKERAFKVGKYLGKDTDDPYDLFEFLQSVPSYDLIALTHKIQTQSEKYTGMSILFSPVVEKKFPNSEAFISDNPLDMLQSGKIERVPLITGYTSGEGLIGIPSDLKTLEIKIKFPTYFLPRNLTETMSEEIIEDFGNRVIKFYGNNKDLTTDDTETVSRLLGDPHVVYNNYRFVHLYAEFCKSIYMYRWNLVTELNSVQTMMGRRLRSQEGACHGDDFFYIFRNIRTFDKYKEQQELQDYVYMITKFWTDFAKTGNPTPDNRWNVKWTPYTSNREYLRIDKTLSIGKDDEKARIDFWNKLYIEAGLPAINKYDLF